MTGADSGAAKNNCETGRIGLLVEWRKGSALDPLAATAELDEGFPALSVDGPNASSVILRVFVANRAEMLNLLDHGAVLGVWEDHPLVGQCVGTDTAQAGDLAENLNLAAIWQAGHRGEGVIVGLVGDGRKGEAREDLLCRKMLRAVAPEVRLWDIEPKGQTLGDVLQALHEAGERFRKTGTPQILANVWGLVRDERAVAEWRESSHPLSRKIGELVALGMSVVFGGSEDGAALALGGRKRREMPLWLAHAAEGGEGTGWADVFALPGDLGEGGSGAVLAGICALLCQAEGGLRPGEIRRALVDTALAMGTGGVGLIRPALAHRRLMGREGKVMMMAEERTMQDAKVPVLETGERAAYPMDAPQPFVGPMSVRDRSRLEDMVGGQTPARDPVADLRARIHAAQAVVDHLVAQYQGMDGSFPTRLCRT